MFQRIQNLYLILIVVAQGLITFLPFVNFSKNDNTFTLNSTGVINSNKYLVHENYNALIVTIIAIIVTLVALVSYKNRSRQMKLCRAISLITLTQICFVSFNVYALINEDVVVNHLSTASYLVILSGILSILAHKGIQKDDQLIRSVDRIR